MTIEEIRKNAPEGATHYEICWKEKPYTLYWKFNAEGMFLWEHFYKKWVRFKFISSTYINKTKPI